MDRLATESYNSPDHHKTKNEYIFTHYHTEMRLSHSGIITLCALLGNIFKVIYIPPILTQFLSFERLTASKQLNYNVNFKIYTPKNNINKFKAP